MFYVNQRLFFPYQLPCRVEVSERTGLTPPGFPGFLRAEHPACLNDTITRHRESCFKRSKTKVKTTSGNHTGSKFSFRFSANYAKINDRSISRGHMPDLWRFYCDFSTVKMMRRLRL